MCKDLLTTFGQTDQYGGTLMNRAHIIFEIIESIHSKVSDPSFSISVKLNSVEFMDGFSAEECRELCDKLQYCGVDFVELSGGTYEDIKLGHDVKESTEKREAYFIEFAKTIAPVLDPSKTLAYLTGGFRSKKSVATIPVNRVISVRLCCIANFLALGKCSKPYRRVYVWAAVWADHVGSLQPSLPSPSLSRKPSPLITPSDCADPFFAKKLLAGTATRAPPEDFPETMVSIVAAGIQLTRISKGQPPLDFSNPQHLDRLYRGIQTWMADMTEKAQKGVIIPGYCAVPDE